MAKKSILDGLYNKFENSLIDNNVDNGIRDIFKNIKLTYNEVFQEYERDYLSMRKKMDEIESELRESQHRVHERDAQLRDKNAALSAALAVLSGYHKSESEKMPPMELNKIAETLTQIEAALKTVKPN